jgi:uncharacterized protein YfdQ (DUF2303 family)
MNPNTNTVIEYDDAVLRRIEKLHEPSPIDIQQTALVALPQGLRLESTKPYLDALRTTPERRAGTAKFSSLASFCEHANRFKDEHSAIFALDTPGAPQLVSVLDYHEKTAAGTPRFGMHRGHYAFPLSDEWNAWKARDQKPMDQRAFAEFLEDRIVDVIDPENVGAQTLQLAEQLKLTLASPSRLMMISRGLSIRVDQKIVQATNLSNGEVQLTYEEVHRDAANAPLSIPSAFVIGIPVFRSGDRFQLFVRLRYRAAGGGVAWSVQLHRTDLVFQRAFEDACEEARELTELPLFYGQPE